MMLIFSSIIGGRLGESPNRLLNEEIKKHEGYDIQITIERAMQGRTAKQNRYLHMIIGIFTAELNKLGNNFTHDEVKDLCKMKFCKQKIYNIDTGDVIGEKLKETSKMSSKEITIFTEQIRHWAAEFFNINLPLPNETI